MHFLPFLDGNIIWKILKGVEMLGKHMDHQIQVIDEPIFKL
jgi:hypothetical protein